LVRPDTE